jgi:anti-sigma factor RsiW
MSCEHFEELLPAYAEGELEGDEKRRVDEHLGGCDTCRQSLAFFTQLESALTHRRELRPSASKAATRVVTRIGLKRRRAFLPSLGVVPASISSGLVALGILWLFFGDVFNSALTGLSEAELATRFTMVMEKWSLTLGNLTGDSTLILSLVTGGLTALILLTGSWMVLRFVRD